MSILDGFASRLRLFFSQKTTEARFKSEIEFHIAMESDRLAREEGLDRGEARRRALVAFGGIEKHREDLRDGRGTAWIGSLSLDFKLGLRMLVKYPGLTLVGVLGMSVAVAIGALAFTTVATITGKSLPLDEGNRIITIESFDVKMQDVRRESLPADLLIWRRALRTVDDLSAYRNVQRNLITGGSSSGSVRVAEMTASAFTLARVAPIRGRYFNAGDDKPGAPDVVVVSYATWQSRFGGRNIIGSPVQLGGITHLVIGVMPEGFAFPLNSQVWAPLRLNPSGYERKNAPSINVLGRLSKGVSIAEAVRELTVLGQPAQVEDSQRDGNVRPRVRFFAQAFIGNPGLEWLFHLAQFVVSLLLVVIGTNVAVLVYARTASRDAELAVRTALGASPRRIVTQLFAEALVLSASASAVGLVIAHFVFQRVDAMVRQSVNDQIPYWMRLEITPAVVLYVAGLAVLAAVIIGVIPGLKATRNRVSVNLQQHFGGASLRLGRTWTALLITQVAVSVTALPIAASGIKNLVQSLVVNRSTLATESFVMATPLPDGPGVDRRDELDRRAHYSDRVVEIARRLNDHPNNFDVVMMSNVPGAESFLRLEIEREPSDRVKHDPGPSKRDASAASTAQPDPRKISEYGEGVLDHVDAGFFAAFEVRTLSGRLFNAADFGSVSRSLIVNRSLVKMYFGGRSVVGQRIRPSMTAEDSALHKSPEPWWEIVGVVDDFPSLREPEAYRPKMYLPLIPATAFPITLAVRDRTRAARDVSNRIREVAVEVDPTLGFRTIRPLQDSLDDEIKLERMGILGIVLVALSVVLLSAAGIYALMSFTVARRRREIGIRSALGASSVRVIVDILSSAMRQIGVGIGIGVLGAAILGRTIGGDSGPLSEFLLLLLGVTAMMVVVGMVATIGPARRALQVQPTEALKS